MFKGFKNDSDIKKEFLKWNESVIKYVPQDRLLVYQVKEGWKPLCDFLGFQEPKISFPHKNKTKNMGHISRFISFLSLSTIIGIIIAIGLFTLFYFTMIKIYFLLFQIVPSEVSSISTPISFNLERISSAF